MTQPPAIQRLEHWTLIASDVGRTQRWYVDVLGARIPERSGPPSVDLAGTLIDIFPSGGITPAGLPFNTPSPGSIGQHHAYIIKLEDYDPWVRHFEELGLTYRRAAHGMGRISIYVDDPDGYHIELTAPFDDLAEGRTEIEKRGLLEDALRPMRFDAR
jgi:catechol 2,3-dioxygenase-like lactoylglutathione lyase family enzyme